MTNTTLISKFALAAGLFATAVFGITGPAHSASDRKPAAAEDIKPPVFEFAALAGATTTETRALEAAEPAVAVWTDDYRPAPAGFHDAR